MSHQTAQTAQTAAIDRRIGETVHDFDRTFMDDAVERALTEVERALEYAYRDGSTGVVDDLRCVLATLEGVVEERERERERERTQGR